MSCPEDKQEEMGSGCCWWEGCDETRVLIAPASSPSSNDSSLGGFLHLRHPKSDKTICYLLVNGQLHELQWFKLPYGSWFLGDYVSKDGCLYNATPVDPVFILLPLFEDARMKKGDEPGKFRQLDEIMFVNDYPGYQQLLDIAENSMRVVCDIKGNAKRSKIENPAISTAIDFAEFDVLKVIQFYEIGSTKFFRLDDAKVLAWLRYKVNRLKQTLPTLDKNFAARTEKEKLVDAVSILGEYLKDEPWMTNLCDELKLNLPEERLETADVISFAPDNDFRSPAVSQEKSGVDKKSARTGRQTKKVKVETESRNIREMFFRAAKCKKG